MRAVLDANVLVSAVLSRAGAPAQVLRAWLDGEFELVTSPLLLGEAIRVLAYPKIRSRISGAESSGLLILLEAAEMFDDPTTPPPVRPSDPDDAYLVALAASARAVLVSGDHGLLFLADRIPVVSPRDFLRQLGIDTE
jgi:uncharacterized protein